MAQGNVALIFGAAGFVGGYLAKELKDHGYAVFGSDLAETVSSNVWDGYSRANIVNAEEVDSVCASVQPTVIVNLAAISSVGQSWAIPQQTMQVNVGGAINVLEAARKTLPHPKVLLVGSSEEYAPSELPLKETDPIDGNNPYGVSKMAQERFAEMYAQRYGLKVYRVSSFNHTGVGQSPSFVLPSWCRQVASIEKEGKPGVLRVGNVEAFRDFGDVRDVVRAYRLFVESDCDGEVLNIGTGRAVKLRTIAEHIASLSSQDISIEVDSSLLRPSDNLVICCDCGKARSLLGWAPEYAIEDTLAAMFQAFLQE